VLQAIRGKAPYDLIVIDKIMPEINGFELAKQLRIQFAERCPKMMMISAGPEVGDEEKARKSGIRSYLARPYKEANLKWTVQQVVRSNDIDLTEVDHDLLTVSDSQQQIQPMQTMPEAYLGATRQSSRFKSAGNSDVSSETASAPDLMTLREKADNHAQAQVSVLVVEDTIVNQKVAQMMLEKLGAKVDIADNGQVAVAKYRKGHFDLIFMDCQMPVLDGFKATREIRELESEGQRIPIIALTANVVKEEKDKCFNAGMDDFVSKPVSQQMLANMLKKYLSSP
jgi:CheY-like chemotaxis protein